MAHQEEPTLYSNIYSTIQTATALTECSGRFYDSERSVFPRFFFPCCLCWVNILNQSSDVAMLIWQKWAYRALICINTWDLLNLSPNSFPGMCKTISATCHVLTQAFNKRPIIAITDNPAKTNTMTQFLDHVHVWTLMSSLLCFSKSPWLIRFLFSDCPP